MSQTHIKFPCLKVEQPIGTFYIGVIDSQDLITISVADVRRKDGREIEQYIGTQRDLNEGRVSEIKKYVTMVDACFPTSIILAVDASNAEYDEKNQTLSILRDKKVAKIIDGQHRIAGLENYSGQTEFQLNVTIFVDMDLEDQAMVFATINLKQTKVTKSLAYDLYEYAESRSPQKTCHNIAKLMNFRAGSPFRNRIKILGKATGIGTEVLTQATFVDRLISLISRDAMVDKDLLKRGKSIEVIEGRKSERLIFRNRFKNSKDAEIAKIIWNYFEAVNNNWPKAWNNFEKGYILVRTTGFAALMRVLPDIWNDMGAPNKIPDVKDFEEYFLRSKLKDKDFTSDNFKPGSTGEGALVKRLSSDILIKRK